MIIDIIPIKFIWLLPINHFHLSRQESHCCYPLFIIQSIWIFTSEDLFYIYWGSNLTERGNHEKRQKTGNYYPSNRRKNIKPIGHVCQKLQNKQVRLYPISLEQNCLQKQRQGKTGTHCSIQSAARKLCLRGTWPGTFSGNDTGGNMDKLIIKFAILFSGIRNFLGQIFTSR